MIGPLHICYGCWLGVSSALLTVGEGVSLTFLCAPEVPFFLLGCCTQTCCEGLHLVLLYLVLCLVEVPGRPPLCLGRGDGGGGSEGQWSREIWKEQREGKLLSGCIL